MDEWLDGIGLYRKNIGLDGSCMFRAVADVFLPANPVSGHLILRAQVCRYLRENKEKYQQRIMVDFDEYLEALAMPKGWGSPLELDVMSHLYRVEFSLYRGPEKPMRVTNNGFRKEVSLCVTNESFYETVYPKSHIDHLGFCQSIVYKILYENVFQLSDIDYAVQKMLHDRTARAQRERFLLEQGIKEDVVYIEEPGDTVNVRKVIDSGAIMFPYKVAKALDPDIYRNINFDVWVDMTRVGRRSTYWFGNGGPIRVGNRCHVKYDGRELTAHIQELTPNHGPAIVYIEELAIKRRVPYDDLIAIPRSALKPDLTFKQHAVLKGGMINRQQETPRRRNDSTRDCQSTTAHPYMTQDSPPIPQYSLIHLPDDQWVYADKHACYSVRDDFKDLPMHDMLTLQFFYNLGIKYFHKGTFLSVPEENKFPVDTPDHDLGSEAYQGEHLIMHPPRVTYAPPPPPTIMYPPHPFMVPVQDSSDHGYAVGPMIIDEHIEKNQPIMPMPNMCALPPPYAQPTPENSPEGPHPILLEPPLLLAPPHCVITSPIDTPTQAPPMLPLLSVPPPSLPPCDVSCSPPRIHDTPHAPREGRERRCKFVKPPRFQRNSAQNRESCSEEVQVSEITSTTSPEEPQLMPMAVPPPPAPMLSYMYTPPDSGDDGSPTLTYPIFTEVPHMVTMDNPPYIEADQFSPICYYQQAPLYYHAN